MLLRGIAEISLIQTVDQMRLPKEWSSLRNPLKHDPGDGMSQLEVDSAGSVRILSRQKYSIPRELKALVSSASINELYYCLAKQKRRKYIWELPNYAG